MGISIDHPYYFILLLVLLGVLIVSGRWFRMKHKFRKRVILILNGIVIISLVLALCGIHIQKNSNVETTIFLLDASDSVATSEKEIIEFVNEALKDCPKDGKVGIVAFGQDTKVEQFVSNKLAFQEFQTTPVTTATNLEKAVQAAMSMFGQDTGKRLVIISDGKENEGNLSNMVYTLLGNQVDVKVHKIKSEIGKEVYVDGVQVSETVKVGDKFNVEVTVQSNVRTTARLSLFQGSNLKKRQTVELQTGKNTFVFQDTQTEEGLKTYRAVIEPADDNQVLNNEYTAFTQAEQSEKVLLIEGRSGQAEEFTKLLDSININYDRVSPKSAPTALNEMMAYKVMITLDVFAKDFADGFLDNLEAYVKDYGGGYIAIGGENSYALGGYKNTSIEKVLPVSMSLEGEKQIPSMSTVYVIDHSSSMASDGKGESKLDLAKEAAIAALENMREIDEVGVLEFDDTYAWAVPIQPLTNVDEIEAGIEGIRIEGGTSIYPAVKAAYEKIRKSNGELKHIVLLSDGEDEFPYSQYQDILQAMGEENITFSTVALGSGANNTLMEKLAEAGEGRYYTSKSGDDLPRIFAQEVFLSTKSYLNNREFTPVLKQKGKILNGVVEEGIPKMLGYIATTIKDMATVHLESDTGEPILASWQYGLGKTIAFTSDGENKWTGNYAVWEKYGTMWKNMIQYVTMDEEEQDGKVEIEQSGSTAHIKYTTDTYSKDSKVSVIYTDEAGKQQTLNLEATGAGKFEKDITFPELGLYMLNVTHKEGKDTVASKNTAVAMQYSREYRYMEESEALNQFVSNVGGVIVKKPKEVFESKLDKVMASYDMTNMWLLFACLVFFFAVAYKRLQFTFIENWCQKMSSKRYEKIIKRKTQVIPEPHSSEETPLTNERKQKEKVKKTKREKIVKDKKVKKQKNKQREMEQTAAMLLKKKEERGKE